MSVVTRSQSQSLNETFSSPAGKTYSLKKISGRLVFPVSPETKGKGDLIYRIKKVSDGRRYVGSSKQTHTNNFGKRLSKYHSEINDDGKKRRQHIIHALRKSPEKFNLKILKHLPGTTEKKLLEEEEKWQDFFETRERQSGYNHSRPTSECLRTKSSRKQR